MATQAKPYRLIPLSRVILCKLYFAHINDDPKGQYTAEDVAQLFSVLVSVNLIRSALDYLRAETYGRRPKYLSRHNDPKRNVYTYKLTTEGLLEVEESLRKKGSDLSYFAEHGDKALDDVAGIDGIYMTREEALITNEWEPLEVDRESSDYKETEEALEAAIEAVRGDNGLAATLPTERAGLLSMLENGFEWFKSKAFTKSVLRTLLIEPFQWVASTFTNTVMGELAKKAAQKLIDYLF